jgi:peptide/nickel transport system substrate-binding protein
MTSEGALAALKAGEVDVCMYPSVPAASIQELIDDPEFGVQKNLPGSSWRVTFNFREESLEKHPWMNDANVRFAMAHAIDRETILDELMYGQAYLISGPLIEFSAFNNPAIEPIPYDPEKAEELLDAAGYPRGTDGVRFSFEMPLYDDAADIAEVLKEYWRDVGIDCELRIVDMGAFLSLYETSETGLGDFACSLNRMGHTEPDAVINFAHGDRSRAGENMGFYNNPEVNAALEAFTQAIPFEDQQEAFFKAQELMYADQPFMFLFSSASVTAYRAKYANFDINPTPGGRNRRLDFIYDTSLPAPEPEPEPEPPVVDEEVTKRVESLETLTQSLTNEVSSLKSEIADLKSMPAPAANQTMSYIAIVVALAAVGMAFFFRQQS